METNLRAVREYVYRRVLDGYNRVKLAERIMAVTICMKLEGL